MASTADGTPNVLPPDQGVAGETTAAVSTVNAKEPGTSTRGKRVRGANNNEKRKADENLTSTEEKKKKLKTEIVEKICEHYHSKDISEVSLRCQGLKRKDNGNAHYSNTDEKFHPGHVEQMLCKEWLMFRALDHYNLYPLKLDPVEGVTEFYNEPEFKQEAERCVGGFKELTSNPTERPICPDYCVMNGEPIPKGWEAESSSTKVSKERGKKRGEKEKPSEQIKKRRKSNRK